MLRTILYVACGFWGELQKMLFMRQNRYALLPNFFLYLLDIL